RGAVTSVKEEIGDASFNTGASCGGAALGAAAGRRWRVRASRAGRRERSVMISATADAGARWPLPLSALRVAGSSGAGAAASGGFTVSLRRLVGATTLALATSAGNKSLKPMRSSMGSAADRGSPPVYQKH